ncbi:MAG: AAA family ATPase [Proteobacteria bacterium]|nr:AAA family ATPase [Pseudomonadota bacterium]
MQSPEPPFLILTCGLTGTGKSTIASAVAERLGATLLRSDVIRKEIAGAPQNQHGSAGFGEGIYSEDYFEKTYNLLMEKGRLLMDKGGHVILDASFKKRRYRTGARRIAEGLGAAFLLIECICPEEEARRRLDSRNAEKTDISDGRWEIYAAQKADFEAVDEVPENEHLVLDTNKDMKDSVNKVLKKLEALSHG